MTENNNHPVPDPNDRILAALSHVMAVMPFWGLIVPIIIWVTQKDKNVYVVFQAIQATIYQLLMIVAYFIGMLFYMCSFFSMAFSMSLGAGNDRTFPIGFIFPFIVFGLIFVGYVIFVVYAIVAAVMVFQGKNFHYLFIGNWLEHYLNNSQPQPQQIDHDPQ